MSYSIGEFSKRTGISIRTLHYYDEIGLLRPEKDPSSGHRIYSDEDIQTLQKIVSLKFLGYRLEEIATLLAESSFTVDLNEMLNLQLQALQHEKDRIERSMSAVKRIIGLLEKEGSVDSSVLLGLIYHMQTEDEQKKWLERHALADVSEGLANKSEDEKLALDQTFIELNRKVKLLYGRPADDPLVQEMVMAYLEASFQFLGEEMMQKLADAQVDEQEIQQLENIAPSPLTEDEQRWLNEAIECYMEQIEED